MSVNQMDQNPLLLKIQRIVNEMPENEGVMLLFIVMLCSRY